VTFDARRGCAIIPRVRSTTHSPSAAAEVRAAPDAAAGGSAHHPRPRRAAAAVAAILVVFLAPAILGAGEFRYRDTGRMHAPTKGWIGEELRRGRLPEWNPYSGLGAPLLANAVDAVQHPFTALFVILPPGAAMTAWIALSLALAASGAFAWARVLGRSTSAAAVAALAFALSGPLVSSTDNVQYLTTYAAAPWVLAAGQAYAAAGGPGRLLLVALASFVCAAAGDPQGWGLAVAAVPVLAAVFADRSARRRAALRGGAAIAVALLAAAPVLVPMALWLPFSERATALTAVDLTRWSLHPRRLAELVVPEIFRGSAADPIVSPVFTALAGNDVTELPWFLSVYLGASIATLAILGAVRDRRTRLLGILALVLVWAALGHYAGFGPLVRHVPILGHFRYWEKVSAGVALLCAACAAQGADVLLEGGAPRWLGRAAAAASALALLVASVAAAAPGAVAATARIPAPIGALLADNLTGGARHAGIIFGLVALVAVGIRAGRLRRAAPVALGAIVALDLFGGNAGAYVLAPPQRLDEPPLAAPARAAGGRVVNPFMAREDRWPELGRVGSMWEWARRTLVVSFNVPYRVSDPDEYVGLREARWSALRQGGEEEDAAPLGLFGYGVLVIPKDPSLAATAGLKPPYRVVGSDPELPAFLVEMPHRPRTYVAEEVVRVDADAALAFARAGGAPGRTVVETPVPDGYAPPSLREARFVRDEPEHIEVEARLDRPGLLVVSDAAAPGWTAAVDGVPARIVHANWAARGVWLPAGTHGVRFDYRTPGLALGWAIALATCASLAAWALAARRRRAASPPP
jgi:hypothetical protein